MTVGETTTKCVMVVFTALLVFFILLATQQLVTIKNSRIAYAENVRAIQERLANTQQTLATQNDNVNKFLLQLQESQSMEDVDVALMSIGRERVKPEKKKR